MESYLNLAPCLYFSCKDDGTLVEVNEFFCKELGYTKQELEFKKLDTIFTIATRIFQQTHFFPLLKLHGHAEEVYITLLKKDNEHIPVLMNAKRIVSNNEGLSIYVGIIVYNRKKYEDELLAAKKSAETALNQNSSLLLAKQELQKHMEHLDKQIQLVNKQNAELQQFNHVITHDLQEPLRKSFVFASMLLEENDSHKQKDITKKLLRVSEQMRSIISGLQQYVWLTEATTKRKSVDLDQIISEAFNKVKEEYPMKQLSIKAGKLPVIPADTEQMEMLFFHIISNSARYSKLTGDVNIKVSSSNLLKNEFRNIKEKYKYSDFVKIEITDDGLGFDPAFKDQVFDLFKRLHNESGRGIGLSLCRKIIENHNGNITIDTHPEEGTTVSLLLPLVTVPSIGQ